jgi:hypothetical protein
MVNIDGARYGKCGYFVVNLGKIQGEKREIVTYIDQMIWLMINDGK